MTLITWILLASASLAGAASPGPSVALLSKTVMDGGRRAGVVFGLAHCLGIYFYAFLVAFGLSVTLSFIPFLIDFLNFASLIFLLWLAYVMLSSSFARSESDQQKFQISNTLFGNFGSGFIYVLIFLVIGGSIGAFIAFKIPMTAMPELVAGFHSLVGLAAVFVAISAFLNPEAFGLGTIGSIKLASLIEMSLGAAIGAITISGSIIAFLKLRGIMSGAPITFKGQHFINLFLGLAIIFLIYNLCVTQSTNMFWTIIALSLIHI